MFLMWAHNSRAAFIEIYSNPKSRVCNKGGNVAFQQEIWRKSPPLRESKYSQLASKKCEADHEVIALVVSL